MHPMINIFQGSPVKYSHIFHLSYSQSHVLLMYPVANNLIPTYKKSKQVGEETVQISEVACAHVTTLKQQLRFKVYFYSHTHLILFYLHGVKFNNSCLIAL